MRSFLKFAVALALGLLPCLAAEAADAFHPGARWLDTAGQPIQAHGGGVLLHEGIYYWYGEDRTPGGHGAVACYSSTNLLDWKREGVVLPDDATPMHDGQRTFVERPKVIYNARTKKFVMWMHTENKDYSYARAGVAVSDTPTGEFKFLHAIRPIRENINFADDRLKQREFGGTYRDTTVFVDDDGHAYAFYASEGNWTMYVVRLNADYTGPEEPAVEGRTWARILVRQMREAPAPFKHAGRYYLITSGCSGWDPNAASYATATQILGPWETHGNPCAGPGAAKTFGTQSTFVLPVAGAPGRFIFMADKWNAKDLPDSRYIWLPIRFAADGAISIEWRDRWDLTAFDAPTH